MSRLSLEVSMDSVFFMIPSLAVLLLVLLLTTIYQIYNKARKLSSNYNLPPGQSGWPIIGETLSCVSCPEKFIHDRMTKFSPDAFRTSLAGERNVVVLCGPLANKLLFSNEDKLVKTWFPRSITDPLFVSNVGRDSSSRKFVKEESLKFLRLQSLERYVAVMDTMTCEHFETLWAPYDEVRVHPLANDFTFDVACRLFMKSRNLSPERVRELSKSFFHLTQGFLAVPLNIPGTTYRRALNQGKLLMKKIGDIIRERKREISGMDQNQAEKEANEDLLGLLLMASHENWSTVNEKDIAVTIMSFLVAGVSSTSHTLTFLVKHLAEHPHVYEKVLQEQLEIARLKGSEKCVNWAHIQKMRYSWNTVCESMRLAPAALGGGFKEAITDLTYAGFIIPKGWKVHWSQHSTYKNPEYFPNPEIFDPTRFEGNGPLPFTFAPFAGGPRICKGKEYVRIQILVFLHHLVTKFRLKKANPDEKVTCDISPTPLEGLRICLAPHNK